MAIDQSTPMNLEFQFLRIPVRVHVWFVLSALALGIAYFWASAPEGMFEHAQWLGVWVAVVFQGIFAHELGHAVVGRAFGLRPRIDLVAFGGQTAFQGVAPLSPGRALLVSAAGPSVSIGIGLAALALDAFVLAPPRGSLGAIAMESLEHVNLYWGLFNLFPLLPLDGGQIVVSFAEMISPTRGRLFAAYGSLTLAALIAVLGIAVGSGFLAILAALAGFTAYQVAQRERMLPRAVQSSADPYGEAQAALRAGQAERLFQLGALLLERAETPRDRDQALHLIAWAHVLRGQAPEAQQALDATSEGYRADPALRGAILLDLGRPDEALPYLEEALERGGPFVRSRIVRAIVQAGRFEEAVELFEHEKSRDLPPIAVEEVYQGAVSKGHLEAALGLAKALYRRVGDGISAVEVARCLARSARPEEGLTWLEKARIAGFRDFGALEADPLLAPIRALPGWESVKAAYAEG